MSAWTAEGIIKAVGKIVSTRQMLFDSLINKLEDDKELRNCVHNILMNGNTFSYNPYDDSTDIALMYGFVKVKNGSVSGVHTIELNGRTIVEGVV